ncbi:hypothetical protein [Hymenobacter sp.]|uniref:hypothetical protein n=1 Tax=Hymenobacter sp. TaxID=1898978 RepID=UPI00286AAB39|nr:hypothetical protein [Hymenobacter sp.]
MLPSFELTSRTITHRPDLGVLIVRWHHDAETAVLQADYQAMLATAEELGCARWLLDVRRREGADPAMGAWASNVFYPAAAARLLPQRLRLAVLTSSHIIDRFLDDPVQKEYVAYMLAPERPFVARSFADEGEAMKWLGEG